MRRVLVVLLVAVAATVWPAANGLALGSATGTAAAAGSLQADFNHDTFADLAVGAPFEAVESVQVAGAVNVLRGSAGLLSATGSQVLTQDSPGIGGAAEQGDEFTGALAASGPQSAIASSASPASPSQSALTTKERGP